jgi:hypothetical protein
MGVLYEAAAVQFWQGVVDKAVGADSANEPDTPASG